MVIYSLFGKAVLVRDNSLVVDVGGIGFQVFCLKNFLVSVKIGDLITIFCYLYIKEGGIELYGFSSDKELEFFKLLISISGVGPKSARSVMEASHLEDVLVAIKEGRGDLLVKAGGIGEKLAQRIILELRNKIGTISSGDMISKIESNNDLIEVLVDLGYKRNEVRNIVSKLDSKDTLENKLKMALKNLSGRGK